MSYQFATIYEQHINHVETHCNNDK